MFSQVFISMVLAIAKFPFQWLPCRHANALQCKAVILASVLLSPSVASAIPTPEFSQSSTVAHQTETVTQDIYLPITIDEFISSYNLTAITPREVALQLFTTYTSEGREGRKSEEMTIEYTDYTAVVRITFIGLADDSMTSVRYRIIFTEKDRKWEMVEVGMQVQCMQNRGPQDWSPGGCT